MQLPYPLTPHHGVDRDYRLVGHMLGHARSCFATMTSEEFLPSTLFLVGPDGLTTHVLSGPHPGEVGLMLKAEIPLLVDAHSAWHVGIAIHVFESDDGLGSLLVLARHRSGSMLAFSFVISDVIAEEGLIVGQGVDAKAAVVGSPLDSGIRESLFRGFLFSSQLQAVAARLDAEEMG